MDHIYSNLCQAVVFYEVAGEGFRHKIVASRNEIAEWTQPSCLKCRVGAPGKGNRWETFKVFKRLLDEVTGPGMLCS